MCIQLVKEAGDPDQLCHPQHTHRRDPSLLICTLYRPHPPPQTEHTQGLKTEIILQRSLGAGYLQSGSKMSGTTSAVNSSVVEVFTSPIFWTQSETGPQKTFQNSMCITVNKCFKKKRDLIQKGPKHSQNQSETDPRPDPKCGRTKRTQTVREHQQMAAE